MGKAIRDQVSTELPGPMSPAGPLTRHRDLTQRMLIEASLYERPFTRHLPRRGILFDVGDKLDDDYLDVLRDASVATGETSFLVYNMEAVDGAAEFTEVSWARPQDYLSIQGIMHALLAPGGAWAVLVYGEPFAALGAKAETWPLMQERLSNDLLRGPSELAAYLRATEQAAHVSYLWVQPLMAHLDQHVDG